jgi:hypothetical protein
MKIEIEAEALESLKRMVEELQAERDALAAQNEILVKWMLTAAELRVQVWRTEEASNRRQDRATQ